MNTLALIYIASASVGVMLGLQHLGIWLRDRSQPAFLLAATMSFAASAIAWLEFVMSQAQTADVYLSALSYSLYPICAVLLSMVWFIRLRLNRGRLWLAILITGMWATGLLIELMSPENFMITSVTIATRNLFWGEYYTVGTATAPLLKSILLDLPTPIIALFVADAGIQSYRSGSKKEALVFAGAIFFFILFAGVHTVLVDIGVVKTPYMISIAFIAIAMALAFGLMDDVASAAATTRNLELQKRHWIALMEGIQLVAIRRNRNGRITYVNGFLQKLMGQPIPSILGKTMEDLAPQRPEQHLKSPLYTEKLSLESRSIGSIETANKEVRDFLWFNVPLENDFGEFDGSVSLGEDVTEMNKAHDELSKTQQDLERLSRILTVGELATTLAHELSQPIGAILSNVQSANKIRELQAKDETDEILEDILRDTRRATAIMKQVRSFALKTPNQFEKIELIDTVRAVNDILNYQTDASNVEIVFVRPEEPVFIEGSRIELQQVMMNLGLNSLQALITIEDSHKRIVFELREQNGFVEICVDDNGPGLLHRDKSEIFDSFSTTKSKGMGIGLAISRRIVERHHGTIDASQSPLGGARFRVVLPTLNEVHEQLHTDNNRTRLSEVSP